MPHTSNKARPRLSKTTLMAALATATLLASSVLHAESLPELHALAKQGQRQQALDRTNKMLASNPKDPQLRFFKGVLLSELNRSNDALAVFQKLTEDYPDFPEPYNNMAVIYAQQNNYDKSRQALESAIRTHPSYATAHENLGDIYARLASQAYSKAFTLDTSKVAARNKLALIRELMTSADKQVASVARPVSSTTSATVATETGPSPTPQAPAVVSAAPPVKASQPSVSTPDAGNAPAVLTQLTQVWAQSWSNKDLATYLSLHSPDFQSPKFSTTKAWKADRARMFKRPGQIRVSLQEISVNVMGTMAQVSFLQKYESAAYSDTTRKTLVFVQKNGTWLIQKEEING